jgi:predicted negative regulator of RcsB-dependent stress response
MSAVPDKEAPVPADERALTDEIFGLELFWAKNKGWIFAGVAVFLLALVAAGAWIVSSHTRARDAERAFALAAEPGAWRQVADTYPRSPLAGSALLLFAASLREEGDPGASTRAYEEFLARWPSHPLEGVARLGLAGNAADAGQEETSLALLRGAADGTGFAAPLALFLEGMAHVDANRPAEARAAFTTLTATFPESLPARFAPAQIQQIDLVLPPATTEP